jgi:hypothetical protein
MVMTWRRDSGVGSCFAGPRRLKGCSEGCAVWSGCGLAGERLPAEDGDIAVGWADLDTMRRAPGHFGDKQGVCEAKLGD